MPNIHNQPDNHQLEDNPWKLDDVMGQPRKYNATICDIYLVVTNFVNHVMVVGWTVVVKFSVCCYIQ